MQEEWRDVVGFPGYQVSNFGAVRSFWHRVGRSGFLITKNTRILHPCKNHDGYPRVELWMNKKRYSRFVHVLVANAFIPNSENKPEVDHIDGNPSNNKVENLRWVTHKENMNNPIARVRLSVNASCLGKFGKENDSSIPRVCIDTGKLYWGAAEAARETNADRTHITACCLGKAQTAGGYRWRYATPEEIEQAKAQ